MNSAAFVGASAMAAVLMMHKTNFRKYHTPTPSACASARVSETAPDSKEPDPLEEHGDLEGLWGLSEEGEEQMRRASIPKSEEQSERVRLAKKAVQPMYVESLGTKGIGRTIPVIGRDVQPNTQPKVSGGCMFYMSDRYTRALEEQ